MPAPSSPASSPDLPEKEASALVDAVQDDAAHDDEQTDVMGPDQLPDFGKSGAQEEIAKRPPQRPSTFTRLLLNPRR